MKTNVWKIFDPIKVIYKVFWAMIKLVGIGFWKDEIEETLPQMSSNILGIHLKNLLLSILK